MFNAFKTLLRLRRGLSQRRTPAGTPPSSLRPNGRKALLLLLTVGGLSALMSVHLHPDRVALRPGDISPRELRAGRSADYLDSAKTARLQQAARESVPPAYTIDEGASISADRIVDQTFEQMKAERAPLEHRILRSSLLQKAIAASQFNSTLSPSAMRRLLRVPPAVFQNLHDTTLRLVDLAMDREIRDTGSDLKQARLALDESISDTLPGHDDQAIVQTVADLALRPNRLFDKRRTEAIREAHARAVPPVVAHLLPGDRILGAGDVVTQEALDKLTALGLVDPRQEVTATLAACLLAAFMVGLVVVYISSTLPRLYRDDRRLALLSVIVLLSVFGLKIGAAMFGLFNAEGQPGYLGMMSVAAAGMLVSMLLDMHLALLIVALLSVQSGILMNYELRFTVMTLMSSLVGIASVNGKRQTHLSTAALALTLVNVGMIWLLGLLFHDTLPELLRGTLWALGAAALATFLFQFGLLALERPFGILTHATLLELSAFDRPLLKRLCAVAPGTYAHSMMVGTLAESAAQAIAADALLCRVAGYYHDIGKINQPEFFVENQRQDNVHGRLSPSLSALIIIAHVRDGIAMAKETRLPSEIMEIIAQHHGTTLISYFYRQALADNGGGACVPPGLEQRFRYPGPKPQTREAAIVMLADSVEAAARCIERPNQEKLEGLISTIFRGKIEDGQLLECPLTFRDVQQISESFLHVLQAMTHGRINYPKPETPALNRSASDESGNERRPTPTLTPMVAIEVLEPEIAGSECLTADPEVRSEIVAHEEAKQRLEERRRQMRPIPLVDPEVLYGRFHAQHSVETDSNRAAPAGSAASAEEREAEPFGSERPSDR